MKSVILVLSCLVTAPLTCGYEVDSGEILKLTTELNRLYNSFGPKDAIIKLSDLYHFANGATGSNEQSQKDKAKFLRELDILADLIAKDTKNPRIYEQLLEQTKEKHQVIGYMIKKTRQDMWNDRFRQSAPIEYTYERIEEVFRGQLKGLLNDRMNPRFLVEALIDGGGACSYFEYSHWSEFSKIAYLLQVFSDRNIHHLMGDTPIQVQAIQKLSKFCEKIRERGSLTKERLNSFLFSLLNEQFDKPIAELEPYVSGSQDICKILREYRHSYMFQSALSFVFFGDCLIELADRFTTFMDKQDLAKTEKLIQAANSSWLKDAIDVLNDMESSQNDLSSYLRQRDEAMSMLDHRTDGSYTLQILEDKDFAEIVDMHDFVERNMRSDYYKSRLRTNPNVETLKKFCNLSNIYLKHYTRPILRSYGRTHKRTRSEYENDKGKKLARLN